MLYIMECDGYYKIGVACNVFERRDTLQCGSPHEINIIEAAWLSNPYRAESALHRELKKHRVIGEWFNVDLKIIKNMLKKEILIDEASIIMQSMTIEVVEDVIDILIEKGMEE